MFIKNIFYYFIEIFQSLVYITSIVNWVQTVNIFLISIKFFFVIFRIIPTSDRFSRVFKRIQFTCTVNHFVIAKTCRNNAAIFLFPCPCLILTSDFIRYKQHVNPLNLSEICVQCLPIDIIFIWR